MVFSWIDLQKAGWFNSPHLRRRSYKLKQKRRYEKPIVKSVTEIEIILECLHEIYDTEGEELSKDNNIHKTMAFPFIKMIEDQCERIGAKEIHKMAWQIYNENADTVFFVKKVKEFLEIYLKDTLIDMKK